MEKIQQFFELVVEVWNRGFLGINFSRIILSLLIFITFLLIRKIFTKFVIHRLAALTEKTKTDLDDAFFLAIERPFQLIPVILGIFLAFEFLQLSGSLEEIADKILQSLIILAIFWSLINIVSSFSFIFKPLKELLTPPIVEWLIKALKVGLTIVGVATVLEIWGIKVAPILAGLGLFGVALALGAQDLFKNLISGILVIAEKRFNPGDWIKVEGEVEGTVENIGFRSTKVRRFDKAVVVVPNSKLSDNAVVNFTEMTHRRIYWMIGVEYRTSVDQLKQIRNDIEKYLLESKEFAKPPEVPTFVRIDRFSDSSIDILVYCFTKTTKWGEWLKIKEEFAYHIKNIVNRAGTAFAFPSQSLYIESIPGNSAEVFVPPSEK